MKPWVKVLGSVACVVACATLYGLLSSVLESKTSVKSSMPENVSAETRDNAVTGNLENVILLGTPAGPMARIVLSLSRGISGVPVIESLQDIILRGSDITVRLNNMRIADGAATGFRVFLNLPDATPRTPVTHDRYVTSGAFFPLPAGKADSQVVGSFVISLKAALAKLAASPGPIDPMPLTMTVVPIGDQRAKIGFESSVLVVK